MKHYYSLATLTLNFGTAAAAASAIQEAIQSDPASGALIGCLSTDIGVLNQMLVLQHHASLESLRAERDRLLRSENPYGCVAHLARPIVFESYEGFAWMPPIRPSAESGITGPVYEIRTYGIRPGGVQKTIDLWQQYIPLRDQVSPCVGAMVALDGVPRFTNLWAYPTLDARSKARADAVAQGIWPPKGGPAWLTTDMVSTIALPTAVSPLR